MPPTPNHNHVSYPSRKGNNQQQELSRHFAAVTKFTRTQLFDKFPQVPSKNRVLQQVNGLAKRRREEGDAGTFTAGLPHPLKEWGHSIDQTGLYLNLGEGFVSVSSQQKVCFSKCLALFHALSFHYLETTLSSLPFPQTSENLAISNTYFRTGRGSHAAIRL